MRLLLASLLLLFAAPQDHPGAEWSAGIHFTKGGKDRKIQYVVMHTVEGSYRGCISWFKNAKSKVSAHYVVAFDGSVTQMVRDKDIAWHAGDREYNKHSIGIEHEGYANKDLWTMAQYKASAAITRRVCLKYKIPIDREHIISHQQITPKRRTDPGPHFNWDLYIALAKGSRKRIADILKKDKKRGKVESDDLRKKVGDWWKAAETFEKKKDWFKAAKYYGKIAYNVEDDLTPKAAAVLKRFKEDAKIAAAIAKAEIEEECRTWMSLGDTYRNGGLLSDSLPHYQRIVDLYPDTDAAKEAAKKIKEVERKLKGK